MAQRLGQVGLARAAGPDDEYRGFLVQIPSGGQVMDQAAIEVRQALEVELVERLGGAELSAPQARAELLLLAPGDLVADEQGQEVGVGQLALNGFAVAGLLNSHSKCNTPYRRPYITSGVLKP